MIHNENNCLRQIPLFANLPADNLELLTSIASHQQLYHKGELMASPDLPQRLIALDQGSAKAYTLSATGKEQVLYLIHPGMIEGQANLFEQTDFPKYIEALQDTALY